MNEEIKENLDLAYNEAEEVESYLLAVRNGEIMTNDLINDLEKLENRLKIVLVCLEYLIKVIK